MNSKKIYLEYNKEVLESKIDLFGSSKNGNLVSTSFEGRNMSNATVSDQYQFFDFKKFAKQILEIVDGQTEINKYNLRIKKGIQEISFLSDPFFIDSDKYYTAWYLLNSNDRTRALQFNAGLLREICSNGSTIPVPNVSSSIRAIHKGQSFLDNASNMDKFIPTVPELVKKQVSTLRTLTTKNVSLKAFVSAMMNENKEDFDLSASSMIRTKAFLTKMFNSSVVADRFNTRENGLSTNEISLILKPLDFIKSQQFDLEVNQYSAFQWYTEIYRNRDSATIRLESERFFNLVKETEPELA